MSCRPPLSSARLKVRPGWTACCPASCHPLGLRSLEEMPLYRQQSAIVPRGDLDFFRATWRHLTDHQNRLVNLSTGAQNSFFRALGEAGAAPPPRSSAIYTACSMRARGSSKLRVTSENFGRCYSENSGRIAD